MCIKCVENGFETRIKSQRRIEIELSRWCNLCFNVDAFSFGTRLLEDVVSICS